MGVQLIAFCLARKTARKMRSLTLYARRNIMKKSLIALATAAVLSFLGAVIFRAVTAES